MRDFVRGSLPLDSKLFSIDGARQLRLRRFLFHPDCNLSDLYARADVAWSESASDHLCPGRRILWLALAGLFIGLEIGIRSAGIFVLPMLALAVWLKLHHRNVTIVTLVAALIVPPAIAPGFERLIHRVEHGDRADSILPYVLVGKAAMLINDNTVFTGPASVSLN